MTTPVKLYRKKPVVIEAIQLTSDPETFSKAFSWIEVFTLGTFDCLPIIEGAEGATWPESGVSIDPRDGRMVIATLEGGHWCNLGDYIIRGVQGEFYPCKPDIFESTYEPIIGVEWITNDAWPDDTLPGSPA